MVEEKKLTFTPFCRLITGYLNVVLNRTAFNLWDSDLNFSNFFRQADRRKATQTRENRTLQEWKTVIHPLMLSTFEGYSNDWNKSMDVDPMVCISIYFVSNIFREFTFD